MKNISEGKRQRNCRKKSHERGEDEWDRSTIRKVNSR